MVTYFPSRPAKGELLTHEVDRHGGLFDRDPLERLGVLGVGDGGADLHVVEAGQRTMSPAEADSTSMRSSPSKVYSLLIARVICAASVAVRGHQHHAVAHVDGAALDLADARRPRYGE